MAKVRVKKPNPAVPNQLAPFYVRSDMQKPSLSVQRRLKSVPRDEANIEAEKGETVYFPDKGGLPAHYDIDGNRHTNGGTPLNVPKDSFVFSDTAKMRIKDPDLLAYFGKKKGSYTPAELAKKYDINEFRKIVQDPDSDELDVKTAEKMIQNYNLKLGKLALVQESKKGFPQGIPVVSMPYMAIYGLNADNILPMKNPGQQQQGAMMRDGGPWFQNAGENPFDPKNNPFSTRKDPFKDPKWGPYTNNFNLDLAFNRPPGTTESLTTKLPPNPIEDQKAYLPTASTPDYTKITSNRKSLGPYAIPVVQTIMGLEQELTNMKNRKIERDMMAQAKTLTHSDLLATAGYSDLGKTSPKTHLDFPNLQQTGWMGTTYGDNANVGVKFGGSPLPKAQWGFGWSGGYRNPWFYQPWFYPGAYWGPAYGQTWNQPNVINQSTVQDYPTGSSTSTTTKKTVTSKVPPAGATIIDYNPATKSADDVIKENNDKLQKGEQIYLRKPDGTYEKIVRSDASISTYNSDLFKTEKHGKMYEAVRQTMMSDKNKAMINMMYKQYRKHIQDSDKLSPERKEALLKLTPEQVRDNFVEAQKQIFKLKESYGPENLQKEIDVWNRGGVNKNKKYKEEMAKLGLTPLNEDQIAAFQAVYRGLQDIADTPEAADLKKFNMFPIGSARTKEHMWKGEGKPISSVDEIFGAATAGEALGPKNEFTTSPFEGEQVNESTNKTSATNRAYTTGAKPAPFWLQDMINVAGAAGVRMGLKKYLPWAPKVSPHVPQAYFMDPSRELAANMEQMQIGTEGAGTFGGPQAYNARFSQIQGAGAKNVANIMSRYHNENIGIANKFSALKADIYNRADQTNAAIATDLYNKTTIANQQYDNAKRQANAELQSAFVNAITNRAKTQTLNMMYPHFQVNPFTGGMLDFYQGEEMIPGADASASAAKMKEMAELKSLYPGWSDETYADVAGVNAKNRRAPTNDWSAYNAMMTGI